VVSLSISFFALSEDDSLLAIPCVSIIEGNRIAIVIRASHFIRLKMQLLEDIRYVHHNRFNMKYSEICIINIHAFNCIHPAQKDL